MTSPDEGSAALRRRIAELEAELELVRQSADRNQRVFEALMEFIPEGITIADAPDVRIRAVSRYGREITGKSRDVLERIPAEEHPAKWEILHADGITTATPEELPLTRAVRLGELVLNEEWALRRADGEVVSILCSAGPIRDGHGRITGGLIAWRDITPYKLALAALAESERRYEALTEQVPEMVYTTRLDGRRTYCNRRWYEYTGFTPEQSLGFEWRAAIHPEDKEQAIAGFAEARAAGTLFQMEYRLRRHDGVYRWFLARSIPIRDEGDRIQFWLGIATDIDDLKQAEQIIAQKQKLESIGLLAGGIAHDFNNLLTGVLGNASIGVEYTLPGTPAHDAFEQIVAASERAADLTRQMLAYAGKGRFVVEPLDLTRLVRDNLRLIRTSIPGAVHLELSLRENLPLINADAAQMQQVVMNLIINAGEAIGDGRPGVIRVNTGLQEISELYVQGNPHAQANAVTPGAHVYLEVRDTGVGMDQQTKARIFEPFFTTKFTGRGLGLSAVQGIVRGHRGVVEIYTAPGRGTTFKILFPVSPKSAPAVTAPKEETGGALGTVLVIEDDPLVRSMATTALERFGCSVLAAKSGEEGVVAFAEKPETIVGVLLDMTMPGLGGRETFRRLREMRPGVPVIVTSGYAEAEVRLQFPEDDPPVFLQKPFSARKLVDLVSEVIERTSLAN